MAPAASAGTRAPAMQLKEAGWRGPRNWSLHRLHLHLRRLRRRRSRRRPFPCARPPARRACAFRRGPLAPAPFRRGPSFSSAHARASRHPSSCRRPFPSRRGRGARDLGPLRCAPLPPPAPTGHRHARARLRLPPASGSRAGRGRAERRRLGARARARTAWAKRRPRRARRQGPPSARRWSTGSGRAGARAGFEAARGPSTVHRLAGALLRPPCG